MCVGCEGRSLSFVSAWAPASSVAGHGWQVSDLGLTDATAGLASAHVWRLRGPRAGREEEGAGVEFIVGEEMEMAFMFVLQGRLRLRVKGRVGREEEEELGEGSSAVVTGGYSYRWEAAGDGTELLQVVVRTGSPEAEA